MKTLNRFFYAAMTAFASVALLASCEKEPQGGDDPTPDPEPSEPTQLATPSLSVEDQTNTSFTVTWKAVTNADSYTYTLNGGAEETTTSTSVEFTSLAAGDYTVKVKATSEDENYTDSEWASTEVTLEEEDVDEPMDPNDINSWVGTWNISSDKVLRWTPGEDNYVYPNVVDGQKTATITIESDPEVENGVMITGLSSISTEVFGMAVPAYGTVVNGQLILQNCEIIWNVNYQDGSTGTLCWLTSSQGSLTTADITVYTLTMGSDNVVTGTPYSADSSYEAYVIKDNGGVSVYTSSADSFAGTWTLTKATANTLTSAKPYSRQYEIKNFEYTVRYPASAKSFIR